MNAFDQPIDALIQGASRGIGYEFVYQLIRSPRVNRVFATCRSPEKSTALVNLQTEFPDKVETISLDVTEEYSIDYAMRQIEELSDCIQLIINCAGLLHDEKKNIYPEKKLTDIDTPAMLESFLVNSIGPIMVIKHMDNLLAKNKRTVIANLSARVGSIADNRLGGWYSYRASKAAQNMLTKTLSVELSRTHPNAICVALHPGTVDTGLSQPFQARVPAHKLFSTQQSVQYLLKVINELTPSDTGSFFAWDGERIPW